MKRLPVYLLIDCSCSMSGEAIEAVSQGIISLIADLRSDVQAMETAHISIITFNSTAQQLCPLTKLSSFVEPDLITGGSSSLGEGLNFLEKCIECEVIKDGKEVKGDWKPIVFIMTDGRPTDRWEHKAEEIKRKNIATIVACGAGAEADTDVLKQITDSVIELNNLRPDIMKSFFIWISASIKTVTKKLRSCNL